MFKSVVFNNGLIKKYLAIFFLCGAAFSSYNVGNLLSHLGIAYYGICILALLKDYRRAAPMLWAAVGAHIILSGYSLWNWHYSQIRPCPYCFAAAGLALSAATARTRLPVLVIPVILMLSMWQAWPFIFATGGDAANTVRSSQDLLKSQNIETVNDSAMQQQKPPASSAAEKKTAPGASPFFEKSASPAAEKGTVPTPPSNSVNNTPAKIKNTESEPVGRKVTDTKEDLPSSEDKPPKSTESG